MWKLLSSEMIYSRATYLNLFLQSFLMFIVLHFWPAISGKSPENPNIGYNSIHHMLVIFAVMILISPWTIEKRTRRFAVLPVRIRAVVSAHLLLFLIYWLVILLLFFAYTLVSSRFSLDPPTPISLLSQTGLVLLIYGLAFAGLDLKRMAEGSPLKQAVLIVMGGTVFGLAFLAVAGVIHNFQNPHVPVGEGSLFVWMYRSPAASVLLILFGSASVMFRVRLFMKSRSYTA